MNKRKKSLIVVIILLVLCLGFGYAYLTTTLTINGTTDVDANTWNVYWDNIQVTTGSVTGAQVTTAPTIDTNKTTVSFRIRLKEPGEFYEFTVDAKNDGTIDAMINVITKTSNIPNYLKYTVTYGDYFPISENHVINVGKKETYRVRVEYRTDINPSDLPSTSEAISLSFGFDYMQANNSISVSRVYYFYGDRPYIGGSINGVTVYNDYHDMTYYGEQAPTFIAVVTNDNIIVEGYVRSIENGEVYFLRGGGATYNESTSSYNDDSIYYSNNINILNNIFGEENCDETVDMFSGETSYTCSSLESSGSTSKNGTVTAGVNVVGYGCGIFSDGSMTCGG